MKKLILITILIASIYSCRPPTSSDPDYPIGTVVYIMPDSIKAVSSGGECREGFLWVQYTTKFGNISEIVINKQLIYK